jgi:hypothetical protein
MATDNANTEQALRRIHTQGAGRYLLVQQIPKKFSIFSKKKVSVFILREFSIFSNHSLFQRRNLKYLQCRMVLEF